MSTEYTWAINKQKLQRAIGECRGGSESEVMDYYKKIGGLVAKGFEDTSESPEMTSQEVEMEETIESLVGEETVEVEAPKKRGRKSKNA